MISDSVKKDFDPRMNWRGVLLVSGAFFTLLFSFLMPKSSSTVTGITLVAFWALHAFGGLAALQAMQMALARVNWIAQRIPVVQVFLAGVLGAAVFTPFAFLMDVLFDVPEDPGDMDRGVVWALVGEFAALAPPFVLVWLALNATRLLRLEPLTQTASVVGVPSSDIWNRLPRSLGRDIVGLSAELHYTRVYTTAGDALILFPFGEAVRDLQDQIDGVQIHRSHWVARKHVQSVDPRGQGAICNLSGDLSLPVSRARKVLLSADGALAD